MSAAPSGSDGTLTLPADQPLTLTPGQEIISSNPELLNKIATAIGSTPEKITPMIHSGLNAIDSMIKKEGSGPEVSSRITSIIEKLVTPFIKPTANIKHALLDPITTYKPAYKVGAPLGASVKKGVATKPIPTKTKKVMAYKMKGYGSQGGGNTNFGLAAGTSVAAAAQGTTAYLPEQVAPPAQKGKKPAIAKPSKPKPEMQGITAPPALDRIVSALSNIETYTSNIEEINNTVNTINTTLSELLEVSKAAAPTAESSVAENENNAQEGGRLRRQTKRRQRKGRRTTRR